MGAALLWLNACGNDPPVEITDESLTTSQAPKLPLPSAEPRPDWPVVRVYVDGLIRGRAYFYDESVCLPLSLLTEQLDIHPEFKKTGDCLLCSAEGFELEHIDGNSYFTLNGRYAFLKTDYFVFSNELYLPSECYSHIFTVDIEAYGDPLCAYISTDSMNIIGGGEEYYSIHSSPEDLYWLSHVISTECTDEPLEGMIGVGNVIMNRVADPEFPNTVMEVLFDTKGGIQFDPVMQGSIHAPPTDLAMIATYLVIEGYNTVGDAEYYVNPLTGNSSWFDRALELVAIIGRHNFYRDGDRNNA